MTKQEFNRIRLAFLDRLRRDARLTPAARLVGWEIGSRINNVSGDAWPAQETIASALGLDSRTVRRSIKDLTGHYFTIRRRGRSLSYVPNFDGGKLDKLSGIDRPAIRDKNVSDPAKAPSNSGAGDVSGTNRVATALFNELLGILGIELFDQRNDANHRARRREEIIWIGEQLALFEPLFDGGWPQGMDGRRFIISLAEEVKRNVRPDTVLRSVRYLEPALARHYRELAALQEQPRRTA
jgi:hypothetical protein